MNQPQINNKIVLADKNQAGMLESATNLHARLRWKMGVDLDLHCFYKKKNGGTGHIYFGNKRGDGIKLDKDSGIGGTAGDNEENMTIQSLDEFSDVYIVANIYGGNGPFKQYDGAVEIIAGNTQFDVPLISEERGAWCVIAHFNNNGISPQLLNINETGGQVTEQTMFGDSAGQSNSGGGIGRAIGRFFGGN